RIVVLPNENQHSSKSTGMIHAGLPEGHKSPTAGEPLHIHSVDECADRLRRAGWSCGDVPLAAGKWLVSGGNSEDGIEARGARQEQARLLGLLLVVRGGHW